jgi:hypothetical protein
MLTSLPFIINYELFSRALENIPAGNEKLILNRPTGNFFYDPWKISDEYKNTVWEEILNTLPFDIGEARIINLQNGTCYMSHSDIDDRYHLGLKGQYSFLIDIDSKKMYSTIPDQQWYEMNAGIRHVAANFGSFERLQIVVRKLLHNACLDDFVSVKIQPICENPRYEFDDEISPWLNKMNKENALSKFAVLADGVQFQLSTRYVTDLDNFSKNKFLIKVL